MMVLGFSEHNAVLNGPGRRARTPNWAISQWAALVESCVALPELKDCAALIDTAFAELEVWLDKQVYPDGVETEESFGYDIWTARSFFDAIALLKSADHAAPPGSYVSKVEQMFSYGVHANDQGGYSPRNGDMDLGKSGWYQPATDYFKRSDWKYIHTGGREGVKPAGGSASTMFPWGGQAIMRNHFEADTDPLWMWIDVGSEYGSSGHAHCSKNAINLRAYGSMLLVDSGRFQYNGAGFSEQLNRQYERTTRLQPTARNPLVALCQQVPPKNAVAPCGNSGVPVIFQSWAKILKRGYIGPKIDDKWRWNGQREGGDAEVQPVVTHKLAWGLGCPAAMPQDRSSPDLIKELLLGGKMWFGLHTTLEGIT